MSKGAVGLAMTLLTLPLSWQLDMINALGVVAVIGGLAPVGGIEEGTSRCKSFDPSSEAA